MLARSMLACLLTLVCVSAALAQPTYRDSTPNAT
jgi:hypothetical protein